MSNKKTTKRVLLSSAIAMLVCVAMLIGATFAWFTDTASTAVNKIQAGNLDVALEMKTGVNADGQPIWEPAENTTLGWVTDDGRPQSEILWEPGCTYRLPELRVINKGDLALKYKIVISGIVGDADLLDVIDFTYGTGIDINNEVSLQPGEATEGIIIEGHMQEGADNRYQGLSIDGIGITVVATQLASEFDSTTNQYDSTAVYPAVPAIVKAVASGKVTDATAPTVVSDDSSAVQATIPANTLSDQDKVELTVERKNVTADSVTYDIDFKVNGAAPSDALNNPVTVNVDIGAGLKDVVATHNGNAMNKVDNAVNDQEYSYNSETGILTIVTKTFSPFKLEYKTDFAAKIGNVGYVSLNSAVAAAAQNDIIYLLKDITLKNDVTTGAQLSVSKDSNVTLDLAGHKFTSLYEGITIANYGTLTINDSSAAKTGIVHNICTTNGNGNYSHDAIRNFGKLTINGGTFGDDDLDRTNANTEHRGAAVRNQAGAVCVINGGFFTCGDNYYTWGTSTGFSYAIRNYGDMTITDGTLYGAMNGGVAGDGGNTTITGGDFSVTGSRSFYVLVSNPSNNATITVNGGTFNKQGGNGGLIGGFTGMPSWDASEALAENGYTITGGTFIHNGEQVIL